MSTRLPPLFSAVALSEVILQLPRWTATPDARAIVCTIKFASFRESMAFLVQLGFVAEAMNHHPEIIHIFDRVTLRLTTHDAGGVTESDLKLAEAINKILDARWEEIVWC